jgi:hypothetical protein
MPHSPRYSAKARKPSQENELKMGLLGKFLWGFVGGLLGKLAEYFRRRKQLKDSHDTGVTEGVAIGKNEVRNEEYREKITEIQQEAEPVSVSKINEQIKHKKERLQ